ncbi:MAG: ComEC family competence protein [Bacteroidales bacterium]|nr:ComEC family competence protein [Bacteroidales bacterium]
MLQKRPLLVVVIVLCLAIIAVEHFTPVVFFGNHYSKHFSQATAFRYRLTSDCSQRAKTILFEAEVEACLDEGRWHKTCGHIRLYFPKSDSTNLRYGDVIESSATMYAIKNFAGQDFDYRKFMKRQRIYHNVYPKSYKKVAQDQYNPILYAAKTINKTLKQRLLHSKMGEQQTALAIGMLLSDKHYIDPEIRHSFNTSGLGHVLCVSGLHIGLIIGLFDLLFKVLSFGNNRLFVFRKMLLVVLAFFIAFIVGFTPSVLRSATMFSVFIIASLTNRDYDRLNVLAFTALIFLILDPLVLFNVSFQLSYLAMAGIMVFLPLFEGIFPQKRGNPFTKRLLYNVKLEAEVSIAAQLFTIPIMAYHFKQIPTYFLLANVVVVPFVGLILAMILLLLCFVDVPLIGDIVGFATDLLLKGLILFTSWIDSLPFAILQ